MQKELFRLIIDGAEVDSQSGATAQIHNPARVNEIVGSFSLGAVEDAKKAIDVAYDAYEKWSETTPRARSQLLFRAAELLAQSEAEMAELLTREQGKTYPESLNEVRLTASVFKYYAGLAPTISGRKVELADPTEFGLVFKQPMGVVVAIAPWNSPVILMAVKLAPALAAGNTIIAKPASSTPLADLLMCELVNKAGFPSGVLNLVTGRGNEIGEELVSNRKVSKVAFTGETETGKTVMSIASRGIKRVSLELGGSDPMIICDDADLDRAIEAALVSRFRNCGQVCMSVKRLYVQDSKYNVFLDRIAERIKKITVGDGLKKESKMGPLHSSNQKQKIQGQLSDALEKGANLIYGGREPTESELSQGYFYYPTLVTDVDQNSKLIQEEVFGPVLPIFKFSTIGEAIDLANDSPYGLGSSIWTKDLDLAMTAASKIIAGTTWINSFHEPQIDLPFGGLKESGLGKEMAIEGLENYLETKAVVVNSKGKKRVWLD
ncbi:MAG: aldehyde dehydrogenase family protein [Thaumarchaeota archaeon]|nr:aldehyde dehydrogenase family protein [Nitrososphaerota archaeon]